MTARIFLGQKLGESQENERKKKKHKKSKKKKSDHCTLFCYFKLTVLSKNYFLYWNYISGYNILDKSIFLANQSASYYLQSLLWRQSYMRAWARNISTLKSVFKLLSVG